MSHETPEKQEGIEKGENVEILLKVLRHGERDKDGKLLDYGRNVTAQTAYESGFNADNYDLVKAIGSTAGEGKGVGKRAFETADIYAETLAGEYASITRPEPLLNFETMKSSDAFNYNEVYNSFLPDNYDGLQGVEKATAAYKAQIGVVNHLISLDTPEAQAYKKEAAGAMAKLIEEKRQLAKKLDPNSRVLMPAGTHGGTMEFVLQQALIRTNEAGEQVVGFKDIEEIGGPIAPSEGYDVDIRTDVDGNFLPIQVWFDNQERKVESSAPMYLDEEKLKELVDFYEKLHTPNTNLRD